MVSDMLCLFLMVIPHFMINACEVQSFRLIESIYHKIFYSMASSDAQIYLKSILPQIIEGLRTLVFTNTEVDVIVLTLEALTLAFKVD